MRILRESFLLLLLWAGASAAVFWWHPDARALLQGGAAATAAEGEVTLGQALLLEKEQNVLWIDVRPAAEFARESIPGSDNIPADSSVALENKLFEWTASERLRPDTVILIVCASSTCRASHDLRDALLAMNPGLNVMVLAGGWAEWKRGRAALDTTAPAQ